MDKFITHKVYTWVNEFNKYIKDILKGKTRDEQDKQIDKLLDEKNKKIEELKTAIDKNMLGDIEREDNHKRCFLIIGEDEDLIEGIVSYIFCFYLTKGKLFFNSEDFTGNDDKTIKEKLIYQWDSNTFMRQSFYSIDRSYSNLIDLMEGIERSICGLLLYFQYGGTLFLRNLKSQDCEMLKFIAMKIRDIVTNNADSHGTLIISTDNKDNLSDYFKNQFKIINLEPEKQSKAKDIPQGKPISTAQNTAKQDKFISFPTPSGTQWHEVKITFLDQENVEIKIKDKTYKKHYDEIGFKDGRKNPPTPVKAWVFLKLLARDNGRLSDYQQTKKDAVEKSVSSLREILVELFKIEGDPIPYKKKSRPRVKSKTDDPGKKSENYAGYETAFKIEDKSYNREYEESKGQLEAVTDK